MFGYAFRSGPDMIQHIFITVRFHDDGGNKLPDWHSVLKFESVGFT